MNTESSKNTLSQVVEKLLELKRNDRKRNASQNFAVNMVRGKRAGSVTGLIQASKQHRRKSHRARTFSRPMATNLLGPRGSLAECRTVSTILSNMSSKLRILKTVVNNNEEWLTLDVVHVIKINKNLTLIKTGHAKYRDIVLQGSCSLSIRCISCHPFSIFSLYGVLFWCLNWKLV